MSAGPIASLLSIGDPVPYSNNALARSLISCSGTMAIWSVTGDLRVEANLHDHLRSRNVAMGRRCRDLVFPLHWNRDGIYELEPSGDTLAMKHKFTGQVDTPRKKLCTPRSGVTIHFRTPFLTCPGRHMVSRVVRSAASDLLQFTLTCVTAGGSQLFKCSWFDLISPTRVVPAVALRCIRWGLCMSAVLWTSANTKLRKQRRHRQARAFNATT